MSNKLRAPFLLLSFFIINLISGGGAIARSIPEIYSSEIDKVKYNLQNKDTNARLVDSLDLNEFRIRHKGFGAMNGEEEKKELLSSKFNDKNRYFNSPFFIYIILAFFLLYLFEILLWKKLKRVDINNVITNFSQPFERGIIIFLLIASTTIFGFFYYNLFNIETYSYTALVKDLCDPGLKTNFLNYADCNYMGAIPVLSLFAYPLFLIFKGSHLGILIFCLVLKIIILLVLYVFSYRFFGPNVAAIASFLFVFATREFSQFSLMGINATQFHSIFFVIMILYLYFSLFLNDNNFQERRRHLFSLIGFVSGFAIYFDPISLITVGFCLLWSVTFFFKKIKAVEVAVFILSFTAGFLPRICYMLTHHMSWCYSDSRIGGLFLIGNIRKNIFNFLPNLKKVIFFNLRRSFIENSPAPHFAADIIFMLFIISLFMAIFYISISIIQKVKLNRKTSNFQFSLPNSGGFDKTLFLFFYIIFYFTIVSFYPSANIRSRYFFPLYPLLFILIGLLVGRRFDFQLPFAKFKIALALITMISIIFSAIVSSTEAMTMSLKSFMICANPSLTKGYSVVGYLHDNLKRHYYMYSARDIYLNDLVLAENASLNFRSSLFLGVYIGDKLTGELSKYYSQLIDYCIDEKYRTFVYEGLSIAYTNRFFCELSDSFKNGVVENAIPRKYRHYFYTNFGFRIGKRYSGNLTKTMLAIKPFPIEFLPLIYKGLFFSLNKDSIMELVTGGHHSVNSRYYPILYRQLGAALVDENDLVATIVNVPPEYKSFFLQGFGSKYSVEYAPTKKVESIINCKDKKYVYEGMGIRWGINAPIYWNNFSKTAANIKDDECSKFFYKGIGRGVFIRFMDTPESLVHLSILDITDSQLQSICRNGVAEEATLY
jgi:hypothetical protein